MIIERKCRTCSEIFDGHFDNWPKGETPVCPKCKSYDVFIWSTDEDLDNDDEGITFEDEED